MFNDDGTVGNPRTLRISFDLYRRLKLRVGKLTNCDSCMFRHDAFCILHVVNLNKNKNNYIKSNICNKIFN